MRYPGILIKCAKRIPVQSTQITLKEKCSDDLQECLFMLVTQNRSDSKCNVYPLHFCNLGILLSTLYYRGLNDKRSQKYDIRMFYFVRMFMGYWIRNEA